MSSYDLKRIQKIELEIFDEFQKLCKNNDLLFFLVGGTCLGAIRNQGMIPWDDDIDLSMPRADYEKLKQIAEVKLGKNYFFQHFENEENCGFIFGKIRRNETILSETYSYKLPFHQGVWIDIFPYDNISDNKFIRRWDFIRFAFYKNIYIIKCGYSMPEGKPGYYQIFYSIAKFISKFFNRKRLIKKLKMIMTRHKDKQTDYVYPYGGAYGEKDILPKNVFENPLEIDFENRKAFVYHNYDMYLKSLYNDYMKLPPIDKRNGGSHFIHEFKDYI